MIDSDLELPLDVWNCGCGERITEQQCLDTMDDFGRALCEYCEEQERERREEEERAT